MGTPAHSGRTTPPPLPSGARGRRAPEQSGPVPKAPAKAPPARLPAPPPLPRETRGPLLRVLPPPAPKVKLEAPAPPGGERRPTLRAAPPPPPSSESALRSAAPPPTDARAPRKIPSAPPPLLPLGKLPPKYVPPVPDEEDEVDTLVEGLEQDSFDASLMKLPPAGPQLPPAAHRAARALEALVEDVVERTDEALLSMSEQRVVRPLWGIAGLVALRSLIVPAIAIFLFGVAVGMPGETDRKTFPKAGPPAPAAGTAARAYALPPPPIVPALVAEEPDPVSLDPSAAEGPAPTDAPAATPASPSPRRAIARRPQRDRRARARQSRRASRARARR
ncbi:MAG: hypothetical protein KF729_21805 [Sandaracinaceae bacterium]|nr:hypothetical protein [Sandaracinaceae bacterium]